ncbi:MAG TPA: Eco29kI family restriction endonuclease [Allosphingosinicella sp.]|jgi:hypothetical protein
MSDRRRRSLENEIRQIVEQLGSLLRELDPVVEPAAVFDPSNPKVVGRFVALALVAQPRCPLEQVELSYGSGIYALYYSGAFPAYDAISGSETPIYVGTASPAVGNARTPYEQGPRLSERIRYHAGNIAKATSTLSLSDFQYRSLVVQSGWEKQAESYLIHLFHPVWNKEVKIMSGFGKHGDSPTMRQHGRSPWDTMHPARTWAGDSASDQKPIPQIEAELIDHFERHPPYGSVEAVLADFLEELRQI